MRQFGSLARFDNFFDIIELKGTKNPSINHMNRIEKLMDRFLTDVAVASPFDIKTDTMAELRKKLLTLASVIRHEA